MRNRERGFQFDSDPRQDRIQQMKQENLYKFRRNRKIFWIKSAGEHSWLSSGASLVSEYFTLLRNITNDLSNKKTMALTMTQTKRKRKTKTFIQQP